MIRKLLSAGSTIAALAIAPTAFAQTTLPGQTPSPTAVPGGVVVVGGQPANGRPMENLPRPFHAKQVIGSKVALQGSQTVGTIDDIVFSDDGTVEYMIVNNGGKLTTVPWRAATFDYQNRTATLSVTPQQYQTVPTYTYEEQPQYYSEQYRNGVYKQYNVEPQPLRRVFNREVNKQLDRINPGQPRPDR